jgi:hypothetical protein
MTSPFSVKSTRYASTTSPDRYRLRHLLRWDNVSNQNQLPFGCASLVMQKLYKVAFTGSWTKQKHQTAMSKKVILVTGSNTGIGFELVRLLAEKGNTVYLTARNEDNGNKAQLVDIATLYPCGSWQKSRRAILKDENLDVKFLRLDVTDIQSIIAAKEHIEKAEGHLDVLVNNAGMQVITRAITQWLIIITLL